MDDEQRKSRAKEVVNTFGGIFPAYQAFYIHTVLYAAGRAEAAFARFDTALGGAADPFEIVASVHEALGHTAALSRVFFPVDKRPLARARAAKLRMEFAVGNNSPLVDRDLRNALEHFDERLDDYLLGDVVGYIFPGPIVDDADLADDRRGHIFRLVDPEKNVFVLLGHKHEFGAVRSEIERVSEMARHLA